MQAGSPGPTQGRATNVQLACSKRTHCSPSIASRAAFTPVMRDAAMTLPQASWQSNACAITTQSASVVHGPAAASVTGDRDKDASLPSRRHISSPSIPYRSCERAREHEACSPVCTQPISVLDSSGTMTSLNPSARSRAFLSCRGASSLSGRGRGRRRRQVPGQPDDRRGLAPQGIGWFFRMSHATRAMLNDA
jgi:hypothetical protein